MICSRRWVVPVQLSGGLRYLSLSRKRIGFILRLQATSSKPTGSIQSSCAAISKRHLQRPSRKVSDALRQRNILRLPNSRLLRLLEDRGTSSFARRLSAPSQLPVLSGDLRRLDSLRYRARIGVAPGDLRDGLHYHAIDEPLR